MFPKHISVIKYNKVVCGDFINASVLSGGGGKGWEESWTGGVVLAKLWKAHHCLDEISDVPFSF